MSISGAESYAVTPVLEWKWNATERLLFSRVTRVVMSVVCEFRDSARILAVSGAGAAGGPVNSFQKARLHRSIHR